MNKILRLDDIIKHVEEKTCMYYESFLNHEFFAYSHRKEGRQKRNEKGGEETKRK